MSVHVRRERCLVAKQLDPFIHYSSNSVGSFSLVSLLNSSGWDHTSCSPVFMDLSYCDLETTSTLGASGSSSEVPTPMVDGPASSVCVFFADGSGSTED